MSNNPSNLESAFTSSDICCCMPCSSVLPTTLMKSLVVFFSDVWHDSHASSSSWLILTQHITKDLRMGIRCTASLILGQALRIMDSRALMLGWRSLGGVKGSVRRVERMGRRSWCDGYYMCVCVLVDRGTNLQMLHRVNAELRNYRREFLNQYFDDRGVI